MLTFLNVCLYILCNNIIRIHKNVIFISISSLLGLVSFKIFFIKFTFGSIQGETKGRLYIWIRYMVHKCCGKTTTLSTTFVVRQMRKLSKTPETGNKKLRICSLAHWVSSCLHDGLLWGFCEAHLSQSAVGTEEMLWECSQWWRFTEAATSSSNLHHWELLQDVAALLISGYFYTSKQEICKSDLRKGSIPFSLTI